MIKQSEIDVLGMDMDGKIYTVDVAFHENGLNYGSKIETKNRIFKKLLRSYLTLLAYFPNKSYELIFTSPKVHNATETIINDYFNVLNDSFSSKNVTFKYLSNDLFKKEILLPTIEKTENCSDSNELFIRSVKLLDLFDVVNTNIKDVLSNATNQEYDNLASKNNAYDTSRLSIVSPTNSMEQTITPRKEFLINGELTSKDIFEKYLINGSCNVKVTPFYRNGKQEQKWWNVSNFTSSSNLNGNLSSGYL